MSSTFDRLDEAAWLEDLEFLVNALLAKHPDPFTKITKEEFDRAVVELRDRIPALPAHAIVIGLKRLLAIIRDGHTNLPLSPIPDFRRYPIRLYMYKDGLHVLAASQEAAGAAGARVLSIGRTPAEEAYEMARGLIGYDNEMWVKLGAASLLVIPEVLHATGIVTDMDDAHWDLLAPSGKHISLSLSPKDRAQEVSWVDARHTAKSPTPLYLKHLAGTGDLGDLEPAEPFWFEYLEASQTVYIQVNKILDKEDETIAQFYDRVFDYLNDHPVERLVIDIRLNPGGNNLLNRPWCIT